MKTASGDSALRGLAAIWLRDSCGCPECRDAGSGQRLVSIIDLPADVWLTATRAAGDSIEVVFGPDGRRGVFSRDWLAEQHSPPEDDRAEDAKRLWAAGDFAAGFPERSWPRYLASEADRAECLSGLLRDGFFLLRGVPCQPGTVLTVAASMRAGLGGREGRAGRAERVAFYAAYRAFTEMIMKQELMLTFRLGPGDCVALDNTRVLHARSGFDAAGQRHLQGCYADLDGVASTLAVLRRGREASR